MATWMNFLSIGSSLWSGSLVNVTGFSSFFIPKMELISSFTKAIYLTIHANFQNNYEKHK